MKLKHLLAALVAALPIIAVAESPAPVQVGIRVGVNTSNISETRITPGLTLSHTPHWKEGFTIGAIVDIPIKHNFYLTPGFYYDYRHNEYDMQYQFVANDRDIVAMTRGEVYTNWFQIPVLMSYRIPVKFVTFQFDFGPYISLGLGGRDKTTTTEVGHEEIMEPMTIKTTAFGYGEDSRYFNIDWGFDFGVGLMFAKHYYIGVHYLIGARNLALSKKVLSKAHSHEWQFSIGYNF
ncbi:MAG: PorT family protein [Bacteroides sp.]|nr:PorT family protein [Bacteroides sp.]MCM1379929.1 PorT family protein [Bacteroides sp.]MCM1446216.1 PorT family protein [Prevotella sp.]